MRLRMARQQEENAKTGQMSEEAPATAATAIFLVASGLAIATSTAFLTMTSSILALVLGGGVAGGAEASGEGTSMPDASLENLRASRTRVSAARGGGGGGAAHEGRDGEQQVEQGACCVAEHSVRENVVRALQGGSVRARSSRRIKYITESHVHFQRRRRWIIVSKWSCKSRSL